MENSAGRRRFPKDVTALGAAGGVSGAMAGKEAQAQSGGPLSQSPGGLAQARGSGDGSPRGLPRIHLLMSTGTLPSVGKDRMDLLRYRESGIPRLSGEQLLEALPEVASIARVTVEAGPPPDNTSYDALRTLSMRIDESLRSPDVDGVVYVQGTN